MVSRSKRLCKAKKPPHKPPPIARRGIPGRVRSTDQYLHQALWRASRKFRHAFPGGFRDETYLEWSETTNGRLIWSGKGLLGENCFDTWCERENIGRSLGPLSLSNRGRTFFSLSKRWRFATRSPRTPALGNFQSGLTASFMATSP